MTIAPDYRNPSPKSVQAYTFLGSGEMADILNPRTCSLCGIVVTNFRIIHPIIRYDPTRPYFHRTGRNRGLSPERRIGWSCGRHRTIDPNWLENSHTLGLAKRNAKDYISAMTAAQELQQIREKLDMSREKFAHELGVTVTTVFKWEKGEHRVNEAALKLARIMANGKSIDNA